MWEDGEMHPLSLSQLFILLLQPILSVSHLFLLICFHLLALSLTIGILTFSSLCPSFLHWCQFASWYLSLGLPSKAQGIFPFLFASLFCSSYSFMFYLFQIIWVFTFYFKLPRTLVQCVVKDKLPAPKFCIHICANYLII